MEYQAVEVRLNSGEKTVEHIPCSSRYLNVTGVIADAIFVMLW